VIQDVIDRTGTPTTVAVPANGELQ
jgi:hypothetical protein